MKTKIVCYYSSEDCRTRFPKQPKSKPHPKMLGNKGNYNNIFRDAMKVSTASKEEK